MDGNTTLNELYHHGVKGMKWGVRKKIQERNQKIRKRRLDKETQKLVADSKTVTAKAEPGKTRMVSGKYMQKRNGVGYMAKHIVDEHGNVKLSYIDGVEGRHFVTTGKAYVNKMNLNQYFHKTSGIYEYDIYK